MHELAITEQIVRSAVPKAEAAGAKRIIAINLKIGELSDIVPSCIEHYLQYAAKETLAEGASIKVEPIPIRIVCRDCGKENEIKRHVFSCPECNSSNFKIIQGREYYIDSLEVE